MRTVNIIGSIAYVLFIGYLVSYHKGLSELMGPTNAFLTYFIVAMSWVVIVTQDTRICKMHSQRGQLEDTLKRLREFGKLNKIEVVVTDENDEQ